jgi:maltose alpha-D-glucosyltransferase/alpha-amylase
MVTDTERDTLYGAYAHDSAMRKNVGIRRRLSPLLGGDRRKIELLNAVLMSLPGSPIIYYGDELGLIDGVIAPGDEQDPWGIRYPDLNRDTCRTPMQWTLDDGMGFTPSGVKPWLPFAHPGNSVATQLDDPGSTLSLYRRLLTLRHEIAELALGDIEMLESNTNEVLAYKRSLSGRTSYVAVNFSNESKPVKFPREVHQVLSTSTVRIEPFTSILLGPTEAIVAR